MFVKDVNIKCAAAELFSAALRDVFPETWITGISPSPLGFIVRCLCFQPIDLQALQWVQERFSFFQKQGLSIEPIEMMRQNAVSLFHHQKQPLLAEQAGKDSKNIVSLVRVGEHYGYNALTLPVDSKTTGEIEILEFTTEASGSAQKKDAQNVFIYMAVCPDKQSRKLFSKKYKEYAKQNHRVIGEKLHLFLESKSAMPGTFIWLEKGAVLKERLLGDCKERLGAAGYEWISFPDQPPQEKAFLKEIGLRLKRLPLRLARSYSTSDSIHLEKEGLFTEQPATTLTTYHLCEQQDLLEEVISSLQFFIRSINMLGIEHRCRLVNPKGQKKEFQGVAQASEKILEQALKIVGLDYTIDSEKATSKEPCLRVYWLDPLEREWDAASLELKFIEDEKDTNEKSRQKKRGLWVVKFTVLASIERLIALFIENSKGFFPEEQKIAKWRDKTIES